MHTKHKITPRGVFRFEDDPKTFFIGNEEGQLRQIRPASGQSGEDIFKLITGGLNFGAATVLPTSKRAGSLISSDIRTISDAENIRGFKQGQTQPLAPSPTPVAPTTFTPEQITGLNVAQTRIAEGRGTATDIKNVDFAVSKGFEAVTKRPITPIPAIATTDNIAPTGSPDLPEPTGDNETKAYFNGLIAQQEKTRQTFETAIKDQRADLKERMDTAQSEIDRLNKKQEGILETDVQPLLQPFREKLEKAERERLKIEENFFANQKTVNELESLLTQAQAEIQAVEDVTGLAAIRNPRIAKKKEDIAARVGILEAVMATRNNQISVASSLIDRSMNAVTADRNDRLNYFNSILSFYDQVKDVEGKKLTGLEAKDKQFLSAQISLLEQDLSDAQGIADYIKDLMIDPSTATLMERGGVKLTDSIETINQKMSDAVTQKSNIELNNSMTSAGYSYASTIVELEGKTGKDIVRIFGSDGRERIYIKREGDIEADVKAVGGGLFDISNNRWVVPPSTASNQDITSLAKAVQSGLLSLSSVPTDIRGQVAGQVDLERIPAKADSEMLKVELQFKKDFDDQVLVKEFRDIVTKSERMNIALEESLTSESFVAVDQALITMFNKITDPNSVVRESEYARTSSDISLLNRMIGGVEKLIQGGAGLTQLEREALVRMANRFTEASAVKFNAFRQSTVNNAIRNGLDPVNIVGSIDESEVVLGGGADPFNVQGAIDEGFSLNEIAERLSTNPAFAGFTNEEIVEVLNVELKKKDKLGIGDESQRLAKAIKQIESGGNPLAKGASGESGAFQFLESTFNTISKQYNKAVNNQNTKLAFTPANEENVAVWKIDQLLKAGNSPEEVALIWNTSLGGSEKPLRKKGINSSGIVFDSSAYAKKVLNTFNKIT